MCKNCYSDPAWDELHYRRQGAVDIEDFDDEPRYRKPGSSTGYNYNNKSKRVPRGCPENNNKSHVWVWTTEFEPTDIFFEHFGFHKRESKVCCGCGKIDKTRETEEYMRRKEHEWRKRTGGEFEAKRGEPLPLRGRYRIGASFWAFRWEDYDEEYYAKYNEWYEKMRNAWRSNRTKPFPRSY